MKNILSIAILLLCFNCQTTAKAPEVPNKNIENSLAQKLNKGAYLVDVRTPEEFAQGSIEGAINIPLDEVQNRVMEFKDKENLVIFCRTGNRSSQAIEILKKNGIYNATNGTNVETVNSILKKE